MAGFHLRPRPLLSSMTPCFFPTDKFVSLSIFARQLTASNTLISAADCVGTFQPRDTESRVFRARAKVLACLISPGSLIAHMLAWALHPFRTVELFVANNNDTGNQRRSNLRCAYDDDMHALSQCQNKHFACSWVALGNEAASSAGEKPPTRRGC